MNTTDLENLLRDDSQANDSEFHSTVYESQDSIMEIIEPIERKGGTRCKVKLETARSPAAQIYDEGDGLPADLGATTRVAYQDWVDIRVVIEMTGHAQRAAGPGFDEFEIEDPEYLTRIALAQFRETAAEQGMALLEYQVSSTLAFPQAGGLSRVANPSLMSWEVDASGAAISAPLLTNLASGGRGSPYGCRPDVITLSDGQFNAALKLANNQISHNLAPGGQSSVMLSPAGLQVGNVPVVPIDYQTGTIALALTGVKTKKIRRVPHSLAPAGYDVLNLGPGEQDRPMRIQLSTSFALVILNPNNQGREYDLAAV